jgi:hypothetical protein
MGAVLSLLLAGSMLVAVLWARPGGGHGHGRPAGRPAAQPAPPEYPTRLGVASAAAVAHPDGISGLGRHDDRRCPR